ncbi:hypothetical protein GCM10011348_30410 [Marinobacterium nitratireducens]|uniref:Uncharacterized protein n=1 Tax=Marinobacterium nitratireducens TaxID=518897 RepID=A0A917ZIZ2_9GAMM|nr:hypothetical protein GCM10011348_30410 [Marinobacterium nitratireducens]
MTVEVPPHLLPVDTVIRGIEIEYQALRRLAIGADELLDQLLVDRHRPAAVSVEFKAAQRRLAGQCLVGPDGGLQHQVLSQILMVIQIFIAKRQPKDTLVQHRFKLVRTAARVTRILDATGNRTSQIEVAVELPQQHDAGIRGDVATFKTGLDLTAFAAC